MDVIRVGLASFIIILLILMGIVEPPEGDAWKPRAREVSSHFVRR